jgi:hypothetical protein
MLRHMWDRGRCRWAAATIGACALALALPSFAQAHTYCVNEPACVGMGGTAEGTNGDAVQKALEAAEAHANFHGPDEVVIGAGTYSRSEAYSYGGNEPAIIRGAGMGATVLTQPAANNSTVAILTSAESTLEDLTVEMPAAEDVLGLSLGAGTAEEVAVAGANAGTSSTGLKLTGGEFTGGAVTMSAAPSSATTDVEASGGGVLTNSSLNGGEYGVQAAGFPLVRGCRIAATAYGLLSYSSSPIVEDTLFDLGGRSAFGVYLLANSANAKATLRQLTIVDGGSSSRGVLVGAEAKHNGSATLASSVISGVETPLTVFGESGGAVGAISTTYSSYEAANDSVGAINATLFAEHEVTGAPSFISSLPGSGDWRLLATSPLIDAGAPQALAAGEYALDAAGKARVVHGRRDVGAYEYQWREPLVSASAPGSAAVGAAVAFTGAGTVQEAGDAIASYEWRFDDGASASGATATHAFATAGAHTATLTVTDSIGLRAIAIATVQVAGPPPNTPVGNAVHPGGGPVRLRLLSLRMSPSVFRAARSGPSILHSKHGGALVSFKLSGAIPVTFTVQRLSAGVVRGRACVARRKGMHGKRCTRHVPVHGSFSVKGKLGANSLRFSGRIGGSRLVPGSYVLVAGAHGSLRASFRIVA